MSSLPHDIVEGGDESDSDVEIIGEVKNNPASNPMGDVIVLPREVQDQLLKFMTPIVEGTSETTGASTAPSLSASARVESNAQSGMNQQQQQTHDVEETDDMEMQGRIQNAIKYMEEVKARYKNRPEVFQSFLKIMRDHKDKSISATCVINRVIELFRGNRDLILGFSVFLPPGAKIILKDS